MIKFARPVREGAPREPSICVSHVEQTLAPMRFTLGEYGVKHESYFVDNTNDKETQKKNILLEKK